MLRQLLAWERDFVEQGTDAAQAAAFDDRIYVFTPQATVIELPAGATPIDFAYVVHTDLGHRCRGAKRRRRDGAAEHAAAERADGRDHRDQGRRAVARLAQRRAGLPAEPALARQGARLVQRPRAAGDTIARGREAVEKLLQREGRTALKLDDLAAQLGFRNADALFEVVGKDEFSLRNIENLLRPPEPPRTPDEAIARRARRAPKARRRAAACWWSASSRC